MEEKEVIDDDEAAMAAMMGFGGFKTTQVYLISLFQYKGKKVQGTDVSAVNIQKKRDYRQYMNRKNGHDRPLNHID